MAKGGGGGGGGNHGNNSTGGGMNFYDVNITTFGNSVSSPQIVAAENPMAAAIKYLESVKAPESEGAFELRCFPRHSAFIVKTKGFLP